MQFINHSPKGHKVVWGSVFLLLVLVLSACGGGNNNEASTGSLTFQASWPHFAHQADDGMMAATDDTPDVCAAFGIDTVTATVLDASGVESGGGSWPCDIDGHKGAIRGIRAGNGYRVVIEGWVADAVAWRGEAANISIQAGRTTAIDRVIMYSLDYILHASASDGGRIEPAGRVAVTEVSEQTFTFIAESGYEITDVAIDGVSQGPIVSYTFSDITADHTIYVGFAPEGGVGVFHTITATSGSGGVIVPAGQVNVVTGNDQVFTFLPDTGSHIVDVFVDDISQGVIPSYTFHNADADHAIRVAYDTTTYTITASATPGGRIDPAGEHVVAYGATPAFNIFADAGYFLAALTVNGQSLTPHTPYVFEPVMNDATVQAVFAPVWHVAAAAAPGGDGRTWQRAFQTLDAAIQQAHDGDEIWIKTGTFLITAQVNINKQVAIYAGFDGSEAYRHQRDWSNQPAIFDGQLSTRCFYITSTARLDGLVIQNSDISGSGYADLQGGAMFIANGASTIANCTFRHNTISAYNTCYGGAVYGYNSSPTFDNCLFEGNSLGCESSTGGALFLENATTVIRNCRFIDNMNDNFGLIGYGGAITVVGGALNIENSDFLRNTTSAETSGGGAINSVNAALAISESRFIENVADSLRTSQGGAVDLSGSGAANSDLMFRNVIFVRNTATGSPRFAYGGAIYNSDASPEFINCTFSGNLTNSSEVSQGGAIYNGTGNATITNTILWGNAAFIDTSGNISNGEGVQLYDPSSLSDVSYSDIDQDNYSGNGNLRVVPRLDRFGHLRSGSACLDMADNAAAPAVDVDGEARPQNDRSDIGADELVDSDDDGMPDFWEAQYHLNSGINDAAGDQDGDGLSNRDEYMAGLDPTDANPWTPARHRGWYNSLGTHDSSNGGTICGKQDDNKYRSYFTFDLGGVSGTAVGAVLRLEIVAYNSIRQSESFNVYHVETDTTTLEASGSGDMTIYDDLADGVLYAQKVTVSPDDVGSVINIHLTAAALAQINASMGARFAVGVGDVAYTLDESDAIIFSLASETRTHQLVLNVD